MAGQQLTVGNFDTGGIVLDSNPFSLQPNQLSGGRNVRFDNGTVSKIAGEQQLLSLGSHNPRTIEFWEQPVNNYYVYTADDGTTHRVTANGTTSEVTKGVGSTAVPLNVGANSNLATSFFNGGATYVVSDGVTVPQYLQAAATTVELQDLPGFNYGDAYSSVIPKIVRPFGNVLVAANLTYTASSGGAITYAPGTYRVSNQAAPGGIPTWDPLLDSADTAEDADASETSGFVDLVPFQNVLYMYTGDSIFAMQLTGNSTFPVAVRKQLDGRGMLTTNCGVEFYGRHFVVGREDIYLYAGGATVQSVAEGRVRDYFFDNLNGAAIDNTFVFHNKKQDEMWVCYPKGSSVACNEALIWNYVNNTWSVRDLNDVYDATIGFDISSGAFTRFEIPVLAKSTELLQADIGTSFSGQAINAYFERKGFDVAPDALAFTKWNDDIYMLVTGMGSIEARIRDTDEPGRPVDFSNKKDKMLRVRDFTLNGDMADFKISPRANGRFMNIRFGSNDATGAWDFVRYVAGIQLGDER